MNKPFLLLLPLIFASAVVSQGTVLINETFDGYANPGGDIASLTAPAMDGLTGNWTYTSNDSGDNYVNRSGTSITDAFEFWKSSDVDRAVRRDTDGNYFMGISANESFYASAIFRTTDIVDGDLWVTLDNDTDGTNSDLRFGFSDGKFLAGGGTSNNTTGGTLAVNTDYRVVIKFTYNVSSTTDRISLWVDPTSEADTPTISSYEASLVRGQFNNAGGGINGLGIFGQQLEGFTSAFVDDILVGTTFAEVVVPEPSTYALALGFLALGVVFLRRRLRS